MKKCKQRHVKDLSHNIYDWLIFACNKVLPISVLNDNLYSKSWFLLEYWENHCIVKMKKPC